MLKFVTGGENLEIVNTILQAEFKRHTKAPRKAKRSKRERRIAARQSASIERIFETHKPDNDPQVKQLQAQLTELRERERLLRSPKSAEPQSAPPPPPVGLPPPPAPPSLPPPPPRGPVRLQTFGGQKPPAFGGPTRCAGAKPGCGPRLIAASGADIQAALRRLKKVGAPEPEEAPAPPPAPEPSPAPAPTPIQAPISIPAPTPAPIAAQEPEPRGTPEKKMDALLADTLAHRRAALVPDESSDDASIKASDSTEF